MRYYTKLSNGYIIAIGTGAGGEQITDTEYNNIMSVIQSRPQAEGKGYKLRTDLAWEEYDLPPELEPSDDDELLEAEALDIILGGGDV